jgi:hypothetical protein
MRVLLLMIILFVVVGCDEDKEYLGPLPTKILNGVPDRPDERDVDFHVTPEPGVVTMVVVGTLLVGYIRRKRWI